MAQRAAAADGPDPLASCARICAVAAEFRRVQSALDTLQAPNECKSATDFHIHVRTRIQTTAHWPFGHGC